MLKYVTMDDVFGYEAVRLQSHRDVVVVVHEGIVPIAHGKVAIRGSGSHSFDLIGCNMNVERMPLDAVYTPLVHFADIDRGQRVWKRVAVTKGLPFAIPLDNPIITP